MRKGFASAVAAVAVFLALASATSLSSRVSAASTPVRPVAAHTAPLSDAEARAVIENYCLECHDEDHAKGDLVLEAFGSPTASRLTCAAARR